MVVSREVARLRDVPTTAVSEEHKRTNTWAEGTPPGRVAFRPTLDEVTAAIVVPPHSRVCRVIKRCVDIVVSAFTLALLSPFFVVLAVLVKATSRGPALFVQDRVGKCGRVFKFYKFRTMVVDAEQRKADLEHLNEMSGPVFKIARDPRITRVGAWLRRSSLDELPQFWNVLKGDMSLVGPRPPVPAEVVRYTGRQVQRLGVTPGLTGLWQVSGRSGIADFDTWVELDLQYAREWSLWLDLQILLKTPAAVVFARGAH
jgi:exopolysaccharide biosynthesis polyprenyl glycosylphosphotransferase